MAKVESLPVVSGQIQTMFNHEVFVEEAELHKDRGAVTFICLKERKHEMGLWLTLSETIKVRNALDKLIAAQLEKLAAEDDNLLAELAK